MVAMERNVLKVRRTNEVVMIKHFDRSMVIDGRNYTMGFALTWLTVRIPAGIVHSRTNFACAIHSPIGCPSPCSTACRQICADGGNVLVFRRMRESRTPIVHADSSVCLITSTSMESAKSRQTQTTM